MSLPRVLVAVLLAVGVPAMLLFGLLYVEEARYWRERRDRLVLGSALSMYYSFESFHAHHGRYPQSVSEEPWLEEAWASVEADLEELGHSVADVSVTGGTAPAESEPRREVLVATGANGSSLLVIYSSGPIAVSRAVLTRSVEHMPEWVEVLE
jgi:hypothetical protein